MFKGTIGCQPQTVRERERGRRERENRGREQRENRGRREKRESKDEYVACA
jgi:hypothetical protein